MHSWGSISGTGHLYTQRNLDLASENKETPWGMGSTQELEGSKFQMRGCAISEGSSSIRSVSAAQSLCGGGQ